jgi:hypothetical protein
MPGGIMQLTAYGGQDYYLTSNPQISYFKNVYRRHSNFSMEMISIEPKATNTYLKESEETNIDFFIDRNADLIKDMYFVFTLPDIYSDNTTKNYKFQWIDRIGEYIIKNVSFLIESREIDKLYSEWMHIWNELTCNESKKNGYNRMIGNISDLTNPLKSDGTTYPFDNSKIRPSISSRKIYVPLPFWFTYCLGSALPLIALQSVQCKVNVTLRSFTELYTIIDSGGDSNRKKSPSATYNLGVFSSSGTTITELDISPTLDINYIFLDNDERKRFAGTEHEYLVHTVQKVEDILTPTLSSDGDTNVIDLSIQHPVSNLAWIFRRSDFKSNNQFSNFTNWADKTINPVINSTDYDEFGTEATFDTTNINNLKYKDILKSAVLKFNGNTRFSKKDAVEFTLVNNYQHMPRIPEDGIYVYSFNLDYDLKKHQPSGACNFSRINNAQLELTTIPKQDSGSSYTYDIIIFAMNFNVLRIIGGMGDLEFSN